MISWRLAASLTAAAAVTASLAIPAGASPFMVGSVVRVSDPNPFSAGCGENEHATSAVNYLNSEVEPAVDADPTQPLNIVGVWQQDRWSDAGAHGLVTGTSSDGGLTWSLSYPPFSRCAGGTVANGGDYARASDPWVSFAPNGVVYQSSLSLSLSAGTTAILVSKSSDGGHHWSNPSTLLRDVNVNVRNDKETVTADPTVPSGRTAYVVWDRLESPNAQASPTGGEHTVGFHGPTWFSRTTDGGATWEPARIIFNPPGNDQTIGSEIVVLPDHTLVNCFMFIHNDSNSHQLRGLSVAIQRSTDQGLTWSKPTIVSPVHPADVTDPTTGTAVRTGEIMPHIAVNRTSGALYVVWQDSGFSHGTRSDIALSKSTDGGLTWTAPVKVNQTPTDAANAKAHAFNPAVHVTTNGTVAISYADFRNYASSTTTLPTSTWIDHSSDGGTTWTENNVSGPFDMRTAPNSRGYFVGDYQGLSAAGNTLHPFFVQTTGDPTNPTDVFTTSAG